MLSIEVFGKSVPGASHVYEDWTIVDETSKLFAVADGVNTPRGSGALAADRALTLLEDSFSGSLASAVARVHTEMVRSKRDDDGVGETTLTALHIRDDDVAEVASVGNCPCYLLRKSELHVLTRFDEDAEGTLTQAIGRPGEIDVHVLDVKLREGDYVILASDGVAHVLNHIVLLPIAREERTAQGVAEAIIERAVATPAKYDEDKSVIVIKVEEEDTSSRLVPSPEASE